MGLPDRYDHLTELPYKDFIGNIMAQSGGKVWEVDIEEIINNPLNNGAAPTPITEGDPYAQSPEGDD